MVIYLIHQYVNKLFELRIMIVKFNYNCSKNLKVCASETPMDPGPVSSNVYTYRIRIDPLRLTQAGYLFMNINLNIRFVLF